MTVKTIKPEETREPHRSSLCRIDMFALSANDKDQSYIGTWFNLPATIGSP